MCVCVRYQYWKCISRVRDGLRDDELIYLLLYAVRWTRSHEIIASNEWKNCLNQATIVISDKKSFSVFFCFLFFSCSSIEEILYNCCVISANSSYFFVCNATNKSNINDDFCSKTKNSTMSSDICSTISVVSLFTLTGLHILQTLCEHINIYFDCHATHETTIRFCVMLISMACILYMMCPYID